MAKHTAKALHSARAVTGTSKHSGKAMSRTTGFGVKRRVGHTAKAISHARPAKPGPRAKDIAAANKRRNFSGIPKTR